MVNSKCAAMVLAGGRGERLGSLTRYYSKPAVHFGGNRRIIDFTLGNCIRSGIESVGVLSQYFSTDLHAYIDDAYGGSRIYMLPSTAGDDLYRGTADAVFKNIDFIDRLGAESLLVLAGDHIYNMNYGDMLNLHLSAGASATVASIEVQQKDAARFGIIGAEKCGRVRWFEEKPSKPKSRLASMGIYIFKWSALRKYLLLDSERILSKHDFGRNIMPDMLENGETVYTFRYNGYWRDVGTLSSLWACSMDFINNPELPGAGHVSHGSNILADDCLVLGHAEHSVISGKVTIGKGSEVFNSVIMPGAFIGENVRIYDTIVGTNAVIMDNTVIGAEGGSEFFVDRKVCSQGISLVAPWLYVPEGMRFLRNSHISKERLAEWRPGADPSELPVDFRYDKFTIYCGRYAVRSAQ